MLKEGKIYALANLVNRASGLLLLPLFTRWLSVAEYGLYALIISLLEVLSMVCGAGLAQAMGRLFFDYAENDPRRVKVVTTALTMMLSAILVVVLLAPLLAEPLALLLTGDIRNRNEVQVAIPGVPCGILLEILSGYYVIRKQPWAVLWLAFAKAGSLFGMTVWLMMGLHLGVWGVFLAQTVAFACVSISVALAFYWRLGWAFDFKLAEALLRFGLPLVPSALADTALNMAARWIVNFNLGAAALGALALAQRVAFVIQAFLSSPFAQVFFVRRLETLSTGQKQDALNKILSGFFLILGLAVLWLSVLAPELMRVLAPQGYDETIGILPLVALGIALAAVNLHVEAGLLYTKRTWVLPMIGFMTLALTVPLIWFGSAYFGLIGAIKAYVCISLLRLLVSYRANRRWGVPEIAVGWAPGFAALLMLSSLAYGLVGLDTGNLQDWQIWLAKGIGLSVVSVSLLLTPLSPPEWRGMNKFKRAKVGE